ncbi:hypothetical protein [Calidifontibacillus erzurumensis]|uniref:hypothetical protein n=1 Tax=Calidifontibacillus erzurumensis TaxID=2741433 RepID=UPI0035B51065
MKWSGILTIILLTSFFFVSACEQPISKDATLYKGKALRIIVIGNMPVIREEQVRFKEMTFESLYNADLNSYDAVFIMPYYLSEAANIKNKKIYRQSKIPIFFIGTKASYLPFITFTESENELSYEDYVKRINDDENFVVGILYTEDYLQSWKFCYGNSIKNLSREADELRIYSDVFRVIESLEYMNTEVPVRDNFKIVTY